MRVATRSKSQRAVYKIFTWIVLAVAAGLLPLFKGSIRAFHEAIEGGELYMIGAVIVLAAVGDLLYSVLPLSEPKQIKVGKFDIFSILFAISIAICFIMLVINIVLGNSVAEVDQIKLDNGIYRSYYADYLIYVFTALASLGTVVLGAMIDD